MAVSMFLKLEGTNLEGESVVGGHEKEIDIYSFDWGMNNTGSAHVATGAGKGKVNVHDLSISKKVDSATPFLKKACARGDHFQKATLMVCEAGGDKPVQYYTLKMETVFITSISNGGHDGGDSIGENISLNFAKYTETYKPQTATGVAGGDKVAGWDIAMNKDYSAP